MNGLMEKFESKLINQDLASPGDILMGQWDADLVWNQPSHWAIPHLEPLFDALNTSTVLFSQPAQPYRTIIENLAEKADAVIRLKDNETRLFLHDIPVLESFTPPSLINVLKQRKCVVVPGYGIITCGAFSPEQTFVNFSSVLFACFVKYFSDYLMEAWNQNIAHKDRKTFARVVSFLPGFPQINDTFETGPFTSENTVYDAVCAVGKPIVNYGLVDSVMGNISYCFKDKVYISQTGSFLDELEGCIDACPMDNSACTGITASSEFSTHMAVYRNSQLRTVVHGHPKFSVIMSLFCEKQSHCPAADACGTHCPEKRSIESIPIVTGETGTGSLSICHTVPQALIAHRGAVVYGHGVFTAGKKDFNEPFNRLCAIEKMCRDMYFSRLGKLTEF